MAASKYTLKISASAEKSFKKLPDRDLRRVTKAILDLAADPHPHGSIKLAGEENCYRIRVGNYRVIYEIQDRVLMILILKVGHRKDVYR